MSLSQLASEVERARTIKANLEAAKAKNAKAFTEQQQNDLNGVTLYLVDAEEVLAQKEAEAAKAVAATAPKEAEAAKAVAATAPKEAYVPAKGTEKLIHLSIVRGHRFDPKTGEEKTKPYVQLFTYGEFLLFAKNHSRLGFDIIKVLHDPYNIVNVE